MSGPSEITMKEIISKPELPEDEGYWQLTVGVLREQLAYLPADHEVHAGCDEDGDLIIIHSSQVECDIDDATVLIIPFTLPLYIEEGFEILRQW